MPACPHPFESLGRNKVFYFLLNLNPTTTNKYMCFSWEEDKVLFLTWRLNVSGDITGYIEDPVYAFIYMTISWSLQTSQCDFDDIE